MMSPDTAAAVLRPRWAAVAWARARLERRVVLMIVLALMILSIPSDGYLGPARQQVVLRSAIGRHGFQFVAQGREALAQKVRDWVLQPGADLSPAAQHELVVAYFAAIEEIGRLNDEIERIFADPRQAEPSRAAAPLQAQLDALRAQQATRRPAVERILEQQTAAVLQAEGLTTAGRVWPPVKFQFAESPNYLIVSPRQRIEVVRSAYLEPSLPVAEMERIEDAVAQGLDVSALIEGTGGFSTYPTIVIETPDLAWVLSTIAHEWTHTYLVFHPLGWRYFDNQEMRTINETVASIVGDEVAQRVIERFYPERSPRPSWPRPRAMLDEADEKPRFSFGAFMRETRLTVDKLLAEGKIVEAESYMEERRRELVARGYVQRKLNQAYFAFHGSYAVGPSATDPIGSKLHLLRQQAGSLAEFMRIVARFTSGADLDAALAQR